MGLLKPPNPWRWRWGAACSMARLSDIDDACGISVHHMFLFELRHASHARLVASSLAIASGEARYAAARER